MDLVFEVRERGGRDVGRAGWHEGGADCEDCGDEFGMVESDAEDDCSAPVVAAEDDGGEAKVEGERGDVVSGVFEGVVGWGVWGGGEGVAHHVGDHDAEVEGEEGGDLAVWF